MKTHAMLSAIATAALVPFGSADVFVYAGTGAIDFADAGDGIFEVGQAYTVEITLETDNASSDQNPNGSAGLFSFPVQYQIRLIVPDAGFDQVIPGNSVGTFDNAGSVDQVSFLGDSLTITLRDEDGTALSSDAIPTSLPPVSAFESPTISYFPPGSPQNFSGVFTTFSVSGASSCAPDLAPPGNPDGLLNFFDISAYIALFTGGDLGADFAPSGAPDGVLNFFDVAEYIAQFQAGCP